MKLVYFSYPYTDAPLRRTEQIRKKVLKILKKNPDWVALVPHFIFDALYGFPKGYSKKAMIEQATGPKEFELISRCDLFVYSPKNFVVSKGCYWEWSFAKQKRIPTKTYEELI